MLRMAKALCPRCLRSLDEADMTAVGGELLCPRCQALAEKGAKPAAPVPAAVAAEPEEAAALPVRVWRAAGEWARGRWWWARLPLLALFAYFLARHLADAEYQDLFKAVNLAIHEWGHYVFKAFGSFMEIFGGTLLQCLAPLLATLMFWKQRDYFAILVCFGWLSTNLFDVAVYVGDARSQSLPLVSPGGGDYVIHDWNMLLGRLGWLRYDHALAGAVRVAAVVSMLLFLVPGSWLVWRMWRTRKEPAPAEGT